MAIQVEGLEVKIKSNGKTASEGINALISSMKNVAKNSEGAQKSLKSFNSVLQNTADIAKSIKENLPKNIIGDYSKSFKGLDNVSKKIGTIKEQMNDAMNTAGYGETSGVQETVEKEAEAYKDANEEIKKHTSNTVALTGHLDNLRWKLNQTKEAYDEAMRKNDDSKARKLAEQYHTLEKQIQSATKAQLNFGKVGEIINKAKSVAFYRIIRTAIKGVTDAMKDGLENAYQFSKVMGGELAEKMDSLASITKQMKNQFGSAFSELIIAVKPALDAIINGAIKVADTISQIFATLNGDKVYKRANPLSEQWKEATASAKKYKDLVLGIDELNILNESSGGAGGKKQEDYASMFEYAPVDSNAWWKDTVDYIRDNFDMIKTTAFAIGGALIGWKVSKSVLDFIKNFGVLKDGLKKPIGLTLAVVGATLEFKGGYDIAKNGANIENIVETILGAGGLIGSGALAFGATSLWLTIPLAIAIPIVGYQLGIKSLGKDAYNESEFKKAIDDLKKRIEGTSAITLDIESKIGLGKDKVKEVQENAIKIQIALNKVFELNAKSYKTIGEINEFTGLVDYLNGLNISGLHLDLDPNGKLVDTKSNMDAIVRDLLITSLQDTVIKELANSMLEFDRATKNANDAWRERDDATRKASDAQKALNDAIAEMNNYTYVDLSAYGLGIMGIGKGAKEAQVKVEKFRQANEEAQKALESANETYGKAKKVEIEAGEALEYYNTMLGDLGGFADDTLAHLGGMTTEFNNQTTAINNEIASVQRLAEELSKVTVSAMSVSVENAKKKFGGGFAEGGFPETGQLFLAREAGAEMVGSIGGHTAVANNDQIVQGIESGVYSAVANALSPWLSQIERNTRESASKDLTVRIGDRDIAKANNRGQKLIGATIMS